MSRTTVLAFSLAASLALPLAPPAASPLTAQEGDAPDVARLVNTVPARSIGPAVMSGRVVDIAVATSPRTHGGELGTVAYIAAASGGVWKTTNGGASWTPVFDDGGVGSIGDVAVAPSNSDIVYVGTGEDNNQRSSSYGDGIYRSVDGGETWEHIGLRESQHTGRIVVHPEDPDVVYVATPGPLWGPGGQRGVYKTTDGGETWEAVLTVDEHTGAADIVMHPEDPDVLWAATFQRERRAYSYVGGGPGSGIWKSTDAGATWERLEHGLPEGDMGRIGLDVSLSHPETLYAVIEGSGEGVYRTDDGGLTWRQTDDISSIPWYFGEIRVDPTDPETVYHLGVPLMRSEDGGETWERAASGGVHVDHHAMWINPENPNHIILGNDGGLYVSRDYGESWSWSSNLPVSQFYAIGYDMQEPFYGVYGGLQDNNTWGGPSRTRWAMGIPNSAWFRMAGGDGFYAAIDPTDHTIAYVESQNGFIVRYDARTGERKSIRPVPEPGLPEFRYNWSAPIKISPWDSNTLYFAANHVFKSTDRGDSWTRLGEDLTRSLDRDSLPMMGGIPDDDAVARHQGTAVFSNISTLDVSALERGWIVTGSDDGVVAVSTDDGQTWTKHTDFPGVPDTTYVSKVRWSKHAPEVIYATFDGHRSNDMRPYVLRSDDRGESWTSIAGDLPEFGNVRAFAQHPEVEDLLFVGTEIAPFVSVDGGESWVRIEDVAPAPVHDLKVHPRDDDLIVGTHGRGIWIVDDLVPWQHLARAGAADGPRLLPVDDALAYSPDGSPSSGMHAARDYAGENPPVGPRISYLIPRGMDGEVTLEILGDGQVIRELDDASSRPGMHHVVWNLRMDAPWSGPEEEDGGRFGSTGPMVVPGTYTARLTVEPEEGEARVFEEPLRVMPDPANRLTAPQLAELRDLALEYVRLDARMEMVDASLEMVEARLEDAEAALEEAGVESGPAADRVESIREELEAIEETLEGPEEEDEEGAPVPEPGVQDRLRQASGILFSISHMPTVAEREALERVGAPLEEVVGRVNALLREELPALDAALDEAGVPWTPGRTIPPAGG